ncbi:MAG: DUF3631 domain-containing protein [Planctomycetes bacterium]|nr:DUF3631 domain-containing protein [Planctomycetota bacterium]
MATAKNRKHTLRGCCDRATAEGTSCHVVDRGFLVDLLGVGSEGAEIELRLLGVGVKPSSVWKAAPEDVICWQRTRPLPPGVNVYFGVGRRHDRDGSAKGVRELRTAWLDLDAKQVPKLVKKHGLRKAIEILRGLLAALKVPPTWVVCSGGGLHAYWTLGHPADPERVRRVNEAIVRALTPAADPQCRDVARVMRLPGSINWKHEYVEVYGEAPRCAIREYTGRTYAIEELEAAFPPAAPRPVSRPIRPLGPNERRDLVPCAKRLLDSWPDPESGLRHKAALVVAGACLCAGVSQAEAEALVEEAARRTGDNEILDRLRAVHDTYASGKTHSYECERGGVGGSCGAAESEACPIERSRRGPGRANEKADAGERPRLVPSEAADGVSDIARPGPTPTIDATEIIAELDAIRSARDGGDRAGAEGKLDGLLRRLEAAAPLQGSASERDGIRRRLRGLGVGAEVLRCLSGGCETEGPNEVAPALFGSVEPWDEAVNGAELLTDVELFVAKYVVLDSSQRLAVCAWILAAWIFDAFAQFAYLVFASPEKRCGKTRLIEVIRHLAPRALPPASSISPAALFRLVDAHRPTVLIDEAQDLTSPKTESGKALNEILCAGNRQDAVVFRCVGDDHEPEPFCVYCPKIIALIGRVNEVLEDRAIVIRMRRKKKEETVERFRHRKAREEAGDLRRRIARWLADNKEAVDAAYGRIEPPAFLNDRAAESWAPLIAVIQVAAPSLVPILIDAAREIEVEDPEDESFGVQLLADVLEIFDSPRAEKLSTKLLLSRLKNLDERPWATWGRGGDGLTPHALARILRPFEIEPDRWREGSVTIRGYRRASFEDAWTRYLPGKGEERP